MKKKWLVALYKINEVKRLESNLLNQRFDYYLPKITTKKINSKPKVEVLFPGYIFINTGLEDYSVLKYTKGIKCILKFGDSIPFISKEYIESMQMMEKTSKLSPINSQIEVGQDALVVRGFLKGNMVKICSLPSRERVDILLSFLGSVRRFSVPKNYLDI